MRIKYSEPGGKILFTHAERIAQAVSPQRWFYGRTWHEAPPERVAIAQSIKKEMQADIDDLTAPSPLRDFISRL